VRNDDEPAMSNSNPSSAPPGIPLPESMAGNFQDAAR